MFDDLLGKKQEIIREYDEAQAEAYADEVNDRYRKLKKSAARFKFDLKKWGINNIPKNVVPDGTDEKEFEKELKEAIERIMKQHGRTQEEINKEVDRVDREMKKKICSDTDSGCETCGGDCDEGDCDDPWGNLTGC